MLAQRNLEYIAPDGSTSIVSVKLYPPESSGADWKCQFEIAWPTGVQCDVIHGIDAVQALILTLQMIGAEIYFSDFHNSGRLKWGKPGDGYGFPVPPNARDLLVGYDKSFG